MHSGSATYGYLHRPGRFNLDCLGRRAWRETAQTWSSPVCTGEKVGHVLPSIICWKTIQCLFLISYANYINNFIISSVQFVVAVTPAPPGGKMRHCIARPRSSVFFVRSSNIPFISLIRTYRQVEIILNQEKTLSKTVICAVREFHFLRSNKNLEFAFSSKSATNGHTG